MSHQDYFTRQREHDGITEIVCRGCGAHVEAHEFVGRDMFHELHCSVAAKMLSMGAPLAREVRFRQQPPKVITAQAA